VSEDIGMSRLLPPATSRSDGGVSEAAEGSLPGRLDINSQRLTSGELDPQEIAVLAGRHGGSVGSLRYEQATGTYAVSGSGADIFQASDQFHFAWKRLVGDGSITARIDSVEHVHDWTKAGVMFRNTLGANSEYVVVHITPLLRVSFEYRSAPGDNAGTLHTDPNAVSLPHWIRLIRQGNRFSAEHSGDGRTWLPLEGTDSFVLGSKTWPVAADVRMSETVYVGMAVTSHAGPFIPAEAKMSHITLTGKVSPPGQFDWSEDIGFQMIALPKK
jgi:hypothetical protein